jgi:hypothetical protein
MINNVPPSGRRSQSMTPLTAAECIWAQLDLACTRSCQTETARLISRKMTLLAARSTSGNHSITTSRQVTLVLNPSPYPSDAIGKENVPDPYAAGNLGEVKEALLSLAMES